MIRIYLITNKINNKIYVGQTNKLNLNTRLVQHFSNAKLNKNNCIILERAIRKHGKENFIIEEISSAINQDDANQLEIDFISKYNSIVEGYNLQLGGTGNRNIFGTNNPRAKLTNDNVLEIIRLAELKLFTQKELAVQFNVSRTTIQRIVYNKNWTSINNRKISMRKLTPEIVSEIKKLLKENQLSHTEIALKYNVSIGMIGHIHIGRSWKHILSQ